MDVISYSDARANFKTVMDRAISDQEEIVVTRRKGEAVVILSLENWNSIQETLYLLSTSANTKALRESIAQLDAGDGNDKDLIDP